MTNLQPVDRLEIQVLVDNVTDTLSSAPAFVTREWPMLQRQGMRVMAGGALCCANHGLALVITAHGPGGPRTLLFDGGPVDYAVERNGWASISARSARRCCRTAIGTMPAGCHVRSA